VSPISLEGRESCGPPPSWIDGVRHDFHQLPIYEITCNVLLDLEAVETRWLADSQRPGIGAAGAIDLRTEAGRSAVHQALMSKAEQEELTGEQRDELARRLAKLLGIDYEELRAKRLLQLMNPQEIRR
jgi:hypothetical protein